MNAAAADSPSLSPSFRLVHEGRVSAAPDIERLVEEWARAFHAAGVLAREPVALAATNSPPLLAAAVALRRAGAVPVLLNPRLLPNDFGRLARQAGARLLLADGSLRVTPAPSLTVALLGSAEARPSLPALAGPAHRGEADYVLYSSGTGGPPKGVLLGHQGFRAHLAATRSLVGLGPSNRWLWSLSMAHVGGLALVLRTLELGATLILPGPNEARDLEDTIRRHGVTHVSLVPTMLRRWMDQRGAASAPPTLQCVLVGGDACPRDLERAARTARLPVRLTYGLTEAWSQVATAAPDTPDGSVGPPLAGVEVRIEDGTGSTSTPGRIQIRGPTLLLGYLGQAPRPSPAQSWFQTGDEGFLDVAGNLWVTGRASRVIISGGQKVDPSEVEAVLSSHPAVAEAVVVGVEDPQWGQAVVAAIVGRPGMPLDLDSVDAYCRSRLAGFKRPRRLLVLGALPQTATGKLDLAAIRDGLRVDDAHVGVHDSAR